ncbi:MAG: metallophosphoesterase [Clostridia bacterium]
MKYFVCADIHGFYDEWINALKEKQFDINNPNHKLIVCGDLFDRGHQPKEIINFVISNKDKIILIKGNHEDLMEEMIEKK